MRILTPAFENKGEIPKKYTCDGENLSPPLVIEGVPKEAESLALLVHDPDAPGGSFTHWTLWNVDPGVERIKEGEKPEGSIEGATDFGKTGYGGPCPPSGTHRYFFRLVALDKKLDLDPGSSRREMEKEAENNILETAELMGRYSRG